MKFRRDLRIFSRMGGFLLVTSSAFVYYFDKYILKYLSLKNIQNVMNSINNEESTLRFKKILEFNKKFGIENIKDEKYTKLKNNFEEINDYKQYRIEQETYNYLKFFNKYK